MNRFYFICSSGVCREEGREQSMGSWCRDWYRREPEISLLSFQGDGSGLRCRVRRFCLSYSPLSQHRQERLHEPSCASDYLLSRWFEGTDGRENDGRKEKGDVVLASSG